MSDKAKKRLLIVNNNLHMGGVQRALVNLLAEIHERYEVTLLLFFDGGELRSCVPDDVLVIEASGPLRYWGMTKDDVGRLDYLARGFWAALTKAFGRGFAFRLASSLQKKLSGYDVVISYLHSGNPHTFYGGCNEFVLGCTDAPRKMSFLHCDYGAIGAQCPYNEGIYQRFDAIAACSEGCRVAFLGCMPTIEGKVCVVPNCHDLDAMHELANESPVVLPSGRLNVLTVARFGKEKGVLRAIQAIEMLGPEINKLSYYLIGEGVEFNDAKALVSELGLSDVVHLLGAKDNPYGYMRAADLLLIPSYSEAASLVIGEAACLGTPVLSTRTSSAEEMISDTGFGWVCENSVEGIRDGLRALIYDPQLLAERTEYLSARTFDNERALAGFDALLER